MKRIGGLYDKIADWDNLREAFRRARRGAQCDGAVLRYERNLDANLRAFSARWKAREWMPGGFSQFVIHDPKRRTIHAPPFADRVAHHAVMRVCEPWFERWLVHESHACRCGKGRLSALEAATRHAARHDWFLKLDVRAYFDSIPHARLQAALARKFKERDLLDFFDRVLASHESRQGRGLPIGSLISQHLANFYLGPLDRWVKEALRLRGYVRYMDDFALWSDDRSLLKRAWRDVRELLMENHGLVLNASAHMNRSARGMDFCGFRIFPGWRVPNRRSRRRFCSRLRGIDAGWRNGTIGEYEAQIRSEALIAFAKEGSSWHLRRRVLARAPTA